MEKVWDFVSGFVKWMSQRLFGGNPKWQFKDWLGRSFEKDSPGPDPYLFQRQLLNFGTIKDDQPDDSAKSQRWLWQSFVAGLVLSDPETQFLIDAGRRKFISTFKLDYERYITQLNVLGFQGWRPTVFEPLLQRNFCLPGSRDLFVDFLKRIKEGFEKKEPGSKGEVITSRATSLRQTLESHYKFWGAEEYLRSEKLIKRGTSAGEVVVDAPPLSQMIAQPGTTPIFGNLWSLGKEQWWTRAEARCAARLARARSGTPRRIYPLQSFQSCLSNDSFSAEQWKAINDVISKNGVDYQIAPSQTYAGPISGGSEYQGWKYCYRNPSVCMGPQRIMWWQKPSKFDDKTPRHKGIDIHDLVGENETIPLVAVANGTVKFDNSDAAGWGNTLILPFQKEGKSFLAVYAHLPEAAKALDGRLVQTGESLGYAGCSGNAGDGKGNCNTYCVVKGANRSDVHLHFEIIEIGIDGNLKQVDPSKLLGFEIASGDDQRLYWCDSPPVDSLSSNRPLKRGNRR